MELHRAAAREPGAAAGAGWGLRLAPGTHSAHGPALHAGQILEHVAVVGYELLSGLAHLPREGIYVADHTLAVAGRCERFRAVSSPYRDGAGHPTRPEGFGYKEARDGEYVTTGGRAVWVGDKLGQILYNLEQD